ncbi:MAG: hypothetical protein WBG70_24040, partial [Spirulinaceae cyanobacterium]
MKSIIGRLSVIAFVSVLSLAPQVSAQEQILHSNNSPRNCQLIEDGEVKTTCDSFKLIEYENFYIFSYLFNGEPIGFVTSSKPFKTEGSTTAYLASQLYIDGSATEIAG